MLKKDKPDGDDKQSNVKKELTKASIEATYSDAAKDIISSNTNEKRADSQLTDEELSALRVNEKERMMVGSSIQNVVDSVDKKKGIFAFLFLKIPMRVMSVSSLNQNQQLINDSYRSLVAPLCPKCTKGILMYNQKIAKDKTKPTTWFCSQSECTFTIECKPTLLEINKILPGKLNETFLSEIQQLSDEDRLELIASHYMKAKLFKTSVWFVGIAAIIQIALGMYVNGLQWLMLAAVLFMFALKWGYRAWQIKTGLVFQEKSLFIPWVKTAPKWFSVDWVDEDDAPLV